MGREGIQVIINFIVLLLLQVFVFNTIYLGTYTSIQIYVMFILFLPANLSSLAVLLLSALMGFSVDLLSSGDLGLHMAACTAIGYIRPYILKKTSTSDVQLEIPKVEKYHFWQYAFYTGILIFVHHLILFSLETFVLKEIIFILTRTIISSIINFSLICLIKVIIKGK